MSELKTGNGFENLSLFHSCHATLRSPSLLSRVHEASWAGGGRCRKGLCSRAEVSGGVVFDAARTVRLIGAHEPSPGSTGVLIIPGSSPAFEDNEGFSGVEG